VRRSSFPHPPWRGLRPDRPPSGEVVHRHGDHLPKYLEIPFIPPECSEHRGPGLLHDVTQYFIPDDKRPTCCIDLSLLCDILRRQHFTTPDRPGPPHAGQGSGTRRFRQAFPVPLHRWQSDSNHRSRRLMRTLLRSLVHEMIPRGLHGRSIADINVSPPLDHGTLLYRFCILCSGRCLLISSPSG